jgi:hypothetical protein
LLSIRPNPLYNTLNSLKNTNATTDTPKMAVLTVEFLLSPLLETIQQNTPKSSIIEYPSINSPSSSLIEMQQHSLVAF